MIKQHTKHTTEHLFLCDEFPIRLIKVRIVPRPFPKAAVYCRTCENMAIAGFINQLYKTVKKAGGIG